MHVELSHLSGALALVLCAVCAGGAFVAGDALMYTGVYTYWMLHLAKQVGALHRQPCV
jgi:hypothetical protein